MEPNINSDLAHGVDLTLPLLRDVGWFLDRDLDGLDDTVDRCLGSDLRGTVFVGTTNTGVENTFFTNGCTISDYVALAAAGAKNHGSFVSAVAHLTNGLRDAGVISNGDKAALQTAAAHSSLP